MLVYTWGELVCVAHITLLFVYRLSVFYVFLFVCVNFIRFILVYIRIHTILLLI